MTRCPHCGLAIDHGISHCRRCGRDVMVSEPEKEPNSAPLFPSAPPAPLHWGVDPSRVVPARPIQSLGNGLSILLGITAGAHLLWVIIPGMGVIAVLLSLVCVTVTLVWLYRARMNVEGLGHHRRAKGWTIGGWFCPVVNLWFPLQIIEDIARIDLPPNRPNSGAPLRYAWWACWLLAWFTGFYYRSTRTISPNFVGSSFSVGIDWGSTTVSRLFGTAAAVLLALVVREISANQEPRAHPHRY